MFDIKEYAEKANQIRVHKGALTNNYLNALSLKKLSDEMDSKLLSNSEVLAIICNDNGVTRLYFHIAGLDKISYLGELLETISIRPMVTEIIGKQPKIDEDIEKLCSKGFLLHTTMNRWSSTNIKFFSEQLYNGNGFRKATLHDADELMRVLYDTFDIYVSHLPSKNKLKELIEEGLVFCFDAYGQIVAVACLERVGTNGIYLYQDAVVSQYRSTGVGILLMQFALSHFKDKNFYTTWIESSNSASNRMHRKLGMTPDGLKCVVLLYQ